MRLATLLACMALFATGSARADAKFDQALAKAEKQLLKQPEEALKTVRKAAGAAKSTAAWLALASFEERLGRLDEAGVSYDKALAAATGAQRADALAARSRYDLRTGSGSTALKRAEEAVATAPSALALSALAHAQLRQGDTEAALASAEKALKASAELPEAQGARGAALVAAQRAGEAIPILRKARAAAPKDAGVAALLVRALAEQGQGAAALEVANEALKLAPERADLLAATALAHLVVDPRDAGGKAISNAQEAVSAEPRSALAKLVVGRVFEARGQFQPATAAYAEAASLDPSWPTPRLAQVQAHYRQHEFAAALAGLDALPPDQARLEEAAILRGKLLLLQENYPAAVAALQAGATTHPRSAEIQTLLAGAHYAAKQLDQAAAAYKRAAELDPANEGLQVNHALLLGYAGKPGEGAALLAKLVAKPGYKDASGFVNLGWLYRAVRPPRVTESVAAYEKALKLEPGNGRAAIGVALAYYGGKHWDQAIRAFERVITVDPRLKSEALEDIGWCYFFKREMAKARSFAQQAQAAGQPEVNDLFDAVKRYEEAVKFGEAAAIRSMNLVIRDANRESSGSLSSLVRQLRAGSPAQQRQSCEALAGLGKPAAPYVGAAVRDDRLDIDVRETCLRSLGRMACAGQPAAADLQYLVDQGPPVPGIDDSKALVMAKLRIGDLVNSAQAVLNRLKACK